MQKRQTIPASDKLILHNSPKSSFTFLDLSSWSTKLTSSLREVLTFKPKVNSGPFFSTSLGTDRRVEKEKISTVEKLNCSYGHQYFLYSLVGNEEFSHILVVVSKNAQIHLLYVSLDVEGSLSKALKEEIEEVEDEDPKSKGVLGDTILPLFNKVHHFATLTDLPQPFISGFFGNDYYYYYGNSQNVYSSFDEEIHPTQFFEVVQVPHETHPSILLFIPTKHEERWVTSFVVYDENKRDFVQIVPDNSEEIVLKKLGVAPYSKCSQMLEFPKSVLANQTKLLQNILMKNVIKDFALGNETHNLPFFFASAKIFNCALTDADSIVRIYVDAVNHCCIIDNLDCMKFPGMFARHLMLSSTISYGDRVLFCNVHGDGVLLTSLVAEENKPVFKKYTPCHNVALVAERDSPSLPSTQPNPPKKHTQVKQPNPYTFIQFDHKEFFETFNCRDSTIFNHIIPFGNSSFILFTVSHILLIDALSEKIYYFNNSIYNSTVHTPVMLGNILPSKSSSEYMLAINFMELDKCSLYNLDGIKAIHGQKTRDQYLSFRTLQKNMGSSVNITNMFDGEIESKENAHVSYCKLLLTNGDYILLHKWMAKTRLGKMWKSREQVGDWTVMKIPETYEQVDIEICREIVKFIYFGRESVKRMSVSQNKVMMQFLLKEVYNVEQEIMNRCKSTLDNLISWNQGLEFAERVFTTDSLLELKDPSSELDYDFTLELDDRRVPSHYIFWRCSSNFIKSLEEWNDEGEEPVKCNIGKMSDNGVPDVIFNCIQEFVFSRDFTRIISQLGTMEDYINVVEIAAYLDMPLLIRQTELFIIEKLTNIFSMCCADIPSEETPFKYYISLFEICIRFPHMKELYNICFDKIVEKGKSCTISQQKILKSALGEKVFQEFLNTAANYYFFTLYCAKKRPSQLFSIPIEWINSDTREEIVTNGSVPLDNNSLVLHGIVQTSAFGLSLFDTKIDNEKGAIWLKDGIKWNSQTLTSSFKLQLEVLRDNSGKSVKTVEEVIHHLYELRFMVQDFGFSFVTLPTVTTNTTYQQRLKERIPLNVALTLSSNSHQLFLAKPLPYGVTEINSTFALFKSTGNSMKINIFVNVILDKTSNQATIIIKSDEEEPFEQHYKWDIPMDSILNGKQRIGFTCKSISTDRTDGFYVKHLYLSEWEIHQ